MIGAFGDCLGGIMIEQQNSHLLAPWLVVHVGEHGLSRTRCCEQAVIGAARAYDLQSDRQSVAAAPTGNRNGRNKCVIDERRKYGMGTRRHLNAADPFLSEIGQRPSNAWRGR